MSSLNLWELTINLIWLLVLVAAFIYFLREYKLLAQPRSWLITKGRVISCEWSHAGPRLWPSIRYRFSVFEREYEGDYLFLDTSHNSPMSAYARQIAYKAAVAFQNNQEIDVYYNPNNPNQAVLDIAIPFKIYLIIGGLAALVIIQLIVFLHLLI